jgi:hypothetical protein
VPFNTRETVAFETPARIETSSIVAIRRFLITRDLAQFTTVIQRDMSLTTAKTIAITLFAEILWKAFSDP